MTDLILHASEAQRYVWTFVIRGGRPFRLQASFHPVLDHPGQGTTLWKMVATMDQSNEAFQIMAQFGGDVERLVEQQTPELIEGRLHGNPD
jgi:hypothetical protein